MLGRGSAPPLAPLAHRLQRPRLLLLSIAAAVFRVGGFGLRPLPPPSPGAGGALRCPSCTADRQARTHTLRIA